MYTQVYYDELSNYRTPAGHEVLVKMLPSACAAGSHLKQTNKQKTFKEGPHLKKQNNKNQNFLILLTFPSLLVST